MSTKILLIDDHDVIRIGIKRMLDESEFDVVAESSTAKGLAIQIERSDADLLLLDVMIGSANIFSEFGKARREFPDFPVLLISAFDNPTFMRRAIDLGAAGYVLKTAGHGVLIACMRNVVRNKTTWSGEEVRRVTGAMATPRLEVETEVAITRRESEVLLLVVNGLTNKEIAVELRISYETVKEHVQHLLRKIGVSDRTQAAVWAVRQGLA